MSTTIEETALRLGLAALLGCVLGLDRELRRKPAGLRTHILIALGAATTTLAALEIHEMLMQRYPDSRGDPLRAIDGVMTGIGFLGAGAIIRSQGDVHGMTTAANIWLCGAIGLACGSGFYWIAVVTFAFTMLTLSGLYYVEKWLGTSGDER